LNILGYKAYSGASGLTSLLVWAADQPDSEVNKGFLITAAAARIHFTGNLQVIARLQFSKDVLPVFGNFKRFLFYHNEAYQFLPEFEFKVLNLV